MLKINEFFFNDHTMSDPSEYDNWQPEDEYDFNEWVKVLVGPESGGGHWYQVHICSKKSLSRIQDKKYIFEITHWENVDALIEMLEKYVNDLLSDGSDSHSNYKELSNYWFWEYEGYN